MRPLPAALQTAAALRAGANAVSCAALRTTPAAWRAPQAAAAGKWRRPLPAGEPHRAPSAHRGRARSSTPPSIPPAAGLQGSPLPAPAAGGSQNRARSPMAADGPQGVSEGRRLHL